MPRNNSYKKQKRENSRKLEMPTIPEDTQINIARSEASKATEASNATLVQFHHEQEEQSTHYSHEQKAHLFQNNLHLGMQLVQVNHEQELKVIQTNREQEARLFQTNPQLGMQLVQTNHEQELKVIQTNREQEAQLFQNNPRLGIQWFLQNGRVAVNKPLDCFIKRSETLSESLQYLRANSHNNSAIIKYLFGTMDLQYVHTSFKGLELYFDQNSQGERVYKSVGILIVSMCMFNRQYLAPFSHRHASGSYNATQRLIEYEIEVKNCKTDFLFIHDLLNGSDKWKEIIWPLLSPHFLEYNNYNTRPTEASIVANATAFIRSLSTVLGIVLNKDVEYFPEAPWEDIIPDGTLMVNGVPKMGFEFKAPLMLKLILLENPNEINVEYSDLPKPFDQVFRYILVTGIPYVISDGDNSLLVVFDYQTAYDNMETWEKEGRAPVPLKVYSSNYRSVLPSLAESNLAWMYEAATVTDTTRESKIKKLKAFYMTKGALKNPPSRANSRSSAKSNSTIESTNNERSQNIGGNRRSDGPIFDQLDSSSISTEPTSAGSEDVKPQRKFLGLDYTPKQTIMAGNTGFQIYVFDGAVVADLGLDLGYHEKVVIKIFDPVRSWRYWWKNAMGWMYEYFDLPGYLDEYYQRERNCIGRLLDKPAFNNCYLEHEEVWASVNDKPSTSMGKCIISKYIETIEMPLDHQTYLQAKHQLDLIHKHDIVHNDITEGNILYSKEGVVYIMDFGLSILLDLPDEDRFIEDNERLWDIFHP